MVTILAFAEYACWATMRLLNCVAISTLELSSEPVTSEPAPLDPAGWFNGSPEAMVAVKADQFWRCNAFGSANTVTGTWATLRTWPLS